MYSLIPRDIVDIKDTRNGVIMGHMKANPAFLTGGVSCKGALTLHASSVQSFIDYVVTEFPTPKQGGDSMKYSSGFNDFRTWDEFIEVATKTPHLLKSFVPKDELLASPDNAGNEVIFDVSGDFLDIGRYLSGDPESFGVMVLGNPRALFATIVMNLSSTCHFDVKGLKSRCQRITRLVDWLEAQGIRTQIKAFHINQCEYLEIDVKRPDESIDLTTLAIVSTPDFFRRLCFRTIEWSPTFSYAYGTSCLVDNGYLDVPELSEAGLYIFSETRESAEKMEKEFDRAEVILSKQISENDKFSKVVI